MLLVENLTTTLGKKLPPIAIKISNIRVAKDPTLHAQSIDEEPEKFMCGANVDTFEYDKEKEKVGNYIDIGFKHFSFNYDMSTELNIIKYGYVRLKDIEVFKNGIEI